MEVLKIATKALQLAIQTTVDGVRTVVDSIKTTTDAIKVKVDTVDTRTNTINTNVSTVKTTAESTKTVVDATKSVADITKTNIDTLLAGRVVKSVQRGEATTSVEGVINITVSAVNVSKSIVILQSQSSNSVAGVLSSPTVIKCQSIDHDTKFSWQLIEFY